MNPDQELRLRALEIATGEGLGTSNAVERAQAYYDFLTDQSPNADLTIKLPLNHQSARRLVEVLREKHLDIMAEMVENQLSDRVVAV